MALQRRLLMHSVKRTLNIFASLEDIANVTLVEMSAQLSLGHFLEYGFVKIGSGLLFVSVVVVVVVAAVIDSQHRLVQDHLLDLGSFETCVSLQDWGHGDLKWKNARWFIFPESNWPLSVLKWTNPGSCFSANRFPS